MNMEGRLCNVLAWMACPNAGAIVSGTLLVLPGVKRNDVDALGVRVTAYTAAYVSNETYVLMFSPAVGILLSIWTGRARILP